jgi:hypothetical protein
MNCDLKLVAGILYEFLDIFGWVAQSASGL